MGLAYIPSWMVEFYGTLVGKYTNPLDPLGMGFNFFGGMIANIFHGQMVKLKLLFHGPLHKTLTKEGRGRPSRKKIMPLVTGVTGHAQKIGESFPNSGHLQWLFLVPLKGGTLPETNICPENGWLEDYLPFGKAYFQGLC